MQAAIVELLRRLQAERGLAILFITHNLALVRSIAQDVVVLANGVVVETGSAEKVLERPSDAYTIELLEDVPKLGSTKSSAPRHVPSRSAGRRPRLGECRVPSGD